MQTLHHLFVEYLQEDQYQDPWIKELCQFLEHSSVDHKKLELTLSTADPQKPKEYLSLLRSFLHFSLLVSKEDRKQYREKMLVLISKRYSDRMSLSSAYEYLLGFLYNFSIEKVDITHRFAEDEAHWPYEQIFHPKLVCELGTIWAICSAYAEDDKWQKASLEIGRKLLDLLDHQNLPFFGLWSRDDEHSQMDTLCSYYLFFYALGKVFHKAQFAEKANELIEHIHTVLKKRISGIAPFYLSLAQFIDREVPKIIVKSPLYEEKNGILDVQNALCGYRGKNFSAVFTLSGLNTGLGAIHSNDVRICSFGPQFFPLNDCRGFGLYRGCDAEKEKFEDGIFRVDSQHCYLKGWTRLCKASEHQRSWDRMSFSPSDTWMQITASANAHRVDMDVLYTKQSLSTKSFFSFYLAANRCVVGDNEKIFNPCTLEHYVGAAKNIRIEGKNSSFFLDVSHAKQMQIIPLAGKDCFWDANFILSYEINLRNPRAKIVLEVFSESF